VKRWRQKAKNREELASVIKEASSYSSGRHWKAARREQKAGKELKRKGYGKIGIENFLYIGLYKTETVEGKDNLFMYSPLQVDIIVANVQQMMCLSSLLLIQEN
jgi:hypothetical protein